MKNIVMLILLLASYGVQAQETGNFVIKNDSFAQLFNKYPIGKPKNTPWAGTFWPYGENGLAWQYDKDEASPAEKFDSIFELNTKTLASEMNQHTCDNLPTSEKKGCKDWWGHCNAWAAAAIKHAEPKLKKKFESETLTVADQKAYLTELWMDSDSLFAGDTEKGQTTGKWIFNPDSSISRQQTISGRTVYDTFWDVTPKAFFLIFTNYVGILKTGVVIDRFTGDQVWNQPVAGYALLPIRKSDIKKAETVDGETLYPVLIRMKIYWADDNVAADHVSKDSPLMEYTAADLRSSEKVEDNDSYQGRLLKFILFFDEPLVTSEEGMKVKSAGNIVGEGAWWHQVSRRKNIDDYDNSHPDFIWLPTELIDSREEGNPEITESRVKQIFKKK